MAHAKFSPSAAHRWMHCPGSIPLTIDVPDTESEYAALGTFAHSLAERALTHNDFEAGKLVGMSQGAFECDEEMADHIQVYLDVVRNLAQKPGSKLLIEHKVQMPGMPVWGTVDAVVWIGDELHVLDFKYGAGVLVDVKDNAQLMIYGLAVLLAIVESPASLHAPERVTFHIVQPRHPLGGHTQHTITADDLLGFEGDLVEAVTAVEKAETAADITKHLVPGDQCRWCPAKATCPALRGHALTAAKDAFATPADKAPPDPSHFSDTELAKVLEAIPVIEVWIKAVHEHAYERVSKGGRVPRHKLVRKSTHRRWHDGAEGILQCLLGDDAYAERKLRSPNQIQKKLEKNMQHVVDELSGKPPGDTVLVHESDPRDAVASADVFLLETEDGQSSA